MLSTNTVCLGIRSWLLLLLSISAACRPLERQELETRLSHLNVVDQEVPAINLLIVAPRQFLEQAENMSLHKETLGVRTQVLEWSGGDSEALKEQIGRIRADLPTGTLRWLLLLGDVDRIPTYYDSDLGDPEFGDYALNAGDVYYTQFPNIGTPYTPALDPQLSIGRIPAKTPAELQIVIDRIQNYERNPPGVDHYYRSPTLVATMQMEASRDTGAPNNYAEYMETEIASRFLESGYRPERIFRTETADGMPAINWSYNRPIDYPSLVREDSTQIPSLLFHMDGSSRSVDAAIQRGTGILMFRGHGWLDTWGVPGYTFDALRFSQYPEDQPPLVFALACLSGFFDSETIQQAGHITQARSLFTNVDANARYLSENMLLNRQGALAVISANRQTSSIYNNRLALGLAQALTDPLKSSRKWHLGDLMTDARIFAKSKGETPEEDALLDWDNRHHMLAYNLLGDPSLEVRTRLPLPIENVQTNYDPHTESLRAFFRVKSLECSTCDETLSMQQLVGVVMDAKQRVIQRGFSTAITGDGGENHQLVFPKLPRSTLSLPLRLYISGAGTIPASIAIEL